MEDSSSKREIAKKVAAQRSKGRKPLGGGQNMQQRANNLSFFSEDSADGWNMSPKSILLFSVAYMGFVILLHIFGKVTSIKKSDGMTTPPPETGGSNSTGGDL